MPTVYKLTCKEKEPLILRTKLQAYNYHKLYRALKYTDVKLVQVNKRSFKAAVQSAYVVTEVKIGSKDLSECDEKEVVIDDMKHARGILRADIRRRTCIPQHLATSTSPLTSEDTPNHADPEHFTINNLIVPLLHCLGYTNGNINVHGGRKKGGGASDILLTLKGTNIVIEAKPMDVSSYDDNSLQVLGYIADHKDDGCIGGIFTDGIRWLLAALVDGDPVRADCDLRQLLKFMYSKSVKEEDYAVFAGTWKYFTELFSSDTIHGSFRTMEDSYRKQKAVEVKAEQ